MPVIIDKDTFFAVQKKLSSNKDEGKRKRAKNLYLLSGLVYCGKCGNLKVSITLPANGARSDFSFQTPGRDLLSRRTFGRIAGALWTTPRRTRISSRILIQDWRFKKPIYFIGKVFFLHYKVEYRQRRSVHLKDLYAQRLLAAVITRGMLKELNLPLGPSHWLFRFGSSTLFF